MRRATFSCFLGLSLVGCFGIGLLVAAMGRNSELEAVKLLHRAADKAARAFGTVRGAEEDKSKSVTTIFAGLEVEAIGLPRSSRLGIGGAITSVGREVLVLRFDGQVFSVSFDGTVSSPNIEVPDNGFGAYLEAIKLPRYTSFRHRPDRFRYNDILYSNGPLGPRLLLSYLQWHAEDNCFTTSISQLTLPQAPTSSADIQASASDWQSLFRTKPCLPLRGVMSSIQGEEAGGRMAVSPDGKKVYLSVGDFGWNGFHSDGQHTLSSVALAQLESADYGKVIEIDLVNGASRHLSVGHRNPQGIVVDSQWRIWTVEHGPRGGDELNLIEGGANYGWPLETLGTDYNGEPIPSVLDVGRHDRFAKPVLAWLPSIAPSSIMSISGFHPAWDGDLLVGSLRGNKLVRVRVDGTRAIFAEEIAMGRRIRDLTQVANEVIALWTDSHEVIFMRPLEGGRGDRFIETYIERLDGGPQLKSAVRQAISECAECHSFNRNEHGIGPSLARVASMPVASADFSTYSDAFMRASGFWSQDRLEAFIANPQAEVPGTTMPQLEFATPEVPGLIAGLLQALALADQ
jgi:aldose sugar dehydrogenase